MSGTLHYEGQEYLGQSALKNTGQSTLYIGLYTNGSAPTASNTMANITEATGGGYTRKPLSATDWSMDSNKTVNNGTLFSQPSLSWLFSASIGIVTGYFITTQSAGTSGKLIVSEQFSTVVNVNQVNFEVRITPNIEFK